MEGSFPECSQEDVSETKTGADMKRSHGEEHAKVLRRSTLHEREQVMPLYADLIWEIGQRQAWLEECKTGQKICTGGEEVRAHLGYNKDLIST